MCRCTPETRMLFCDDPRCDYKEVKQDECATCADLREKLAIACAALEYYSWRRLYIADYLVNGVPTLNISEDEGYKARKALEKIGWGK